MLEHTAALPIKKSDQDIITEIQKNGYYIDRVEKTPERCLAAVKQNGLVLKLIPKAIHTIDLCLEAVKQNGLALKYISKKVLTSEIYFEAVRNNGIALSYVPDTFKTRELCLAAVKKNGEALQYVSDKYKSQSVCKKAIKRNGLALEFVPRSILSKDFYLAAVKQNGLALEHVPGKGKSEELCITAVIKNALALEYVPDRFKKPNLCNTAVHSNWKAFIYVPKRMYTLNRCLEVFKFILRSYDNPSEMSYSIEEIVERLPDDVNNEIQIIRLERQLRARYFREKLFDRSTNKFITKEFICYREENETKEFETFIEFYEYLDGNLENADLYDFDFKGINLSNFNIEGSCISSAVLIEHNLYDDSFYVENIRDNNHITELMLSAENEVVEASAVLHDYDFSSSSTLNDNSRKIYYISDIHLNHKLLKEFPAHATKQEVTLYIKQLIKEMLDSATDKSVDDYLLIAGDISDSFGISVLFYTELVKHWGHHKIVVVLGNHELLGYSLNESASVHANNLENIIQRYRDLFINLKIHFLQNDLCILNETQTTIISEEQLMSIDPCVLKSNCLKSSLTILGGVGYTSSLDTKFNITHKRFESIYKKTKDAISSNQVIVLTHTPKERWSSENYNSNWIYVNGHTHRNDYYCTDEKTVFADNQIGYYNSSIGLKHFKTSQIYDIFRNYTDGISDISREQYLDFNRGLGINITFNRIGKIHMLKNSGVYCFILENAETGKFYLLDGGAINNLEHNDVNYYFERMQNYSDAINEIFSEYHQSLKSISNTIKMIGGTGTIHGCIVDLDYYNHIYLNPTDGTITPYFASSIVNKFVYPDVHALLIERREDLYDNYTKLLSGMSEGVKLLKGETNTVSIAISRFIPETHMYRPSRIMKSLQYLTDVNVIRIWNDRVMDIRPCIEDQT